MKWRVAAIGILLVTLSGVRPVEAQSVPSLVDVLGNVTAATRPVENAVVIAFNLSGYLSRQTRSTADGGFSFGQLPAGVYRIIAVKHGFAPAMTTVLPARLGNRLALRLAPEANLSARQRSDVWEVRRLLPSDVLREIDLEMGNAPYAEGVESARLAGNMTSLAEIAQDQSATQFAETAVGMRGRIGESWHVGFEGRHEQSTVASARTDESQLVASSGFVMEVESSPYGSYKLSSAKNRWRPTADVVDGNAREVGFESHQLGWKSQAASVELRYLAQGNVFSELPGSSELVELSGSASLIDSPRSKLRVSILVGQEMSPGRDELAAQRSAKVSTSGSFAAGRFLAFDGGVHAHLRNDVSELSPETAARVRLSPGTTLIISGLYKAFSDETGEVKVPALVFLRHASELTPRSRYAIGIVSGTDETGLIQATLTQSEIDSVARVIFSEAPDSMWDGFYLIPGDVYRDLTLAVRKNLRSILAIDFSASAGTAQGASNQEQIPDEKVYVSGVFQSTFRPSGTSMSVVYRRINDGEALLASNADGNERLNLRMSQSLNLPLGLRLLVGVDLARDGESTLADANDSQLRRRLLGGVSLAF